MLRRIHVKINAGGICASSNQFNALKGFIADLFRMEMKMNV